MEVIRKLALIVALVCCLPASAAAQSPDLAVEWRVAADTLERVHPNSGESMWVVSHPSVWDTKKRETKKDTIIAPVVLADDTYYAVGGWLFRLDIERGVIEQRLSFPATIVALGVAEEMLELTLETTPNSGDADDAITTKVRYRPGGPTPRGTWELVYWLKVWKDVSYLADPIGAIDGEFDEEQRREAIAAIQRQRHQEPGNPFYDFFLGEQHFRLGEDDLATKYFDAAAANAGAPWVGDLHLAMMFDEVGQYDRGDIAFERGLKKLDAHHPTFRQTSALVVHAMMMGIWSRDAIEKAVLARDFEAVDRMQTRALTLFPHLEDAPRAWLLLSDWYAENGRPALAKKWSEASREAMKAPWALTNGAREFDVAMALAFGFTFSFWLVMLLIGLRSPASTRSDWLPRPGKADAVGLIIALLLPLPCYWLMWTSVAQIGTFAAAPIELTAEGWGSPNVSAWLEERAPSAARDELLAHSKALQKAYAAGTAIPEPLRGGAALVSATVEADAAKVAATSAYKNTPLAEGMVDMPDIRYLIPPWAIFAAFLMVLGAGIRNSFPRVARGLCIAIPGGARSATVLTGVLAGLALAAVASILTPIDSILTSLATPAFGKYFGLSTLDQGGDPEVSLLWAWLALGAVLAVHVLTTWLDRRGEVNAR